jgi:hypothetical protein
VEPQQVDSPGAGGLAGGEVLGAPGAAGAENDAVLFRVLLLLLLLLLLLALFLVVLVVFGPGRKQHSGLLRSRSRFQSTRRVALRPGYARVQIRSESGSRSGSDGNLRMLLAKTKFVIVSCVTPLLASPLRVTTVSDARTQRRYVARLRLTGDHAASARVARALIAAA